MPRFRPLPMLYPLVLLVGLSPLASAQSAALLDVSGGQVPDDTGSDGKTTLTTVENSPLGGPALKVDYAPNDSFGDRRARVADWTPFAALEFMAFNPAENPVKLVLTVRHRRTTGYPTRVDVPITLRPGKNPVRIGIDRMRNVNGTVPDLAAVVRWYLAVTGDDPPTLYFGDIGLVGGEAPAAGHPSAEARPAIKTDPRRLARIRAAKMPEIKQPVLFFTPEADAICAALEVFPPDNPWNQIVDELPVHPNSDAIIASIGADKSLRYNPDMAFVLVPPEQERVEVKVVEYPDESNPGPFPVPPNVPIEGWPGYYDQSRGERPPLAEVQREWKKYAGDRHAIVVDPVKRMLYEFYVFRRTDGGWEASQASVFDLKSNKPRPSGWTSADAAGLPVFPAVVRYDELERGVIDHALRVTVRNTRRAFIPPARHFASRHENPDYPAMGQRIRLKADYDISGFSPNVQTVLTALKRYGMLVADNGIDWAVSVAPDPRIPPMHEELRKIPGSAFEVVQTRE